MTKLQQSKLHHSQVHYTVQILPKVQNTDALIQANLLAFFSLSVSMIVRLILKCTVFCIDTRGTYKAPNVIRHVHASYTGTMLRHHRLAFRKEKVWWMRSFQDAADLPSETASLWRQRETSFASLRSTRRNAGEQCWWMCPNSLL